MLLRVAPIAVLVLALGAGLGGCRDSTPSYPGSSPPRELAAAPAPEVVTRTCRDNAVRHEVPMRCPRLVPAAASPLRLADLDVEGGGDFGPGRCDWLTGFQYPRPPGSEPSTVFHLLVGGRCTPFPLATRNGR